MNFDPNSSLSKAYGHKNRPSSVRLSNSTRPCDKHIAFRITTTCLSPTSVEECSRNGQQSVQLLISIPLDGVTCCCQPCRYRDQSRAVCESYSCTRQFGCRASHGSPLASLRRHLVPRRLDLDRSVRATIGRGYCRGNRVLCNNREQALIVNIKLKQYGYIMSNTTMWIMQQ